MLRDFFLGFVRIHILHHAAEEPIYGLAMIEELGRHGYEVSPGTIYPILHGMERGGWLVK
jgi:DNA-binding PadR family transcriptional regulator